MGGFFDAGGSGWGHAGRSRWEGPRVEPAAGLAIQVELNSGPYDPATVVTGQGFTGQEQVAIRRSRPSEG